MRELVIFGTGSFGELAHFYFTKDSEYRVVAFTETDSHRKSESFMGMPVVSFETIGRHYPPDRFKLFIAVGYVSVNKVRASLCDAARAKGYSLATYVSSKSTHWGDTKIGQNCFIFEDNTIQPFVKLGDDVILWSGNHIGHHSVIDNHVFVTSHVVVSGYVRVGAFSFLGVNATIRDGVEIGESCVIGGGAMIMKSTQPGDVYIAKRTERSPLQSTDIRI